MSVPRSFTCLVLALAPSLAACAEPRERDLPGGVHPAGWADPDSDGFHGLSLRDAGYPLAGCRSCHGSDYRGGVAGSDCESAGCHDRGVASCGTCHGDDTGPLPRTGAHAIHARYCDACHPVTEIDSPGHIDGAVDVMFSGIAVTDGAPGAWDAGSRRCADTHCHGAVSPAWIDDEPLGCDGCHGAPPASHARYARVAGEDACQDCHPVPNSAAHVDGAVTVLEPGCDGCHGTGSDGLPPPALDGATDAGAPGVGAHRAHADATLPDRIGRVVACTTCHAVPAGVSAAGHIDDRAPADVTLPRAGRYDPVAQSCTVWCHFNTTPGPIWTDDTGAARACDACHGMPPVMTRIGTPHPPADPTSCALCHQLAASTHVDGVVDLR